MGRSDGPTSAASQHEQAFLAARNECKVLFSEGSPSSIRLAIERWQKACAEVRPHVSSGKWISFQTDFIAVLESDNQIVAASEVRRHMWRNDPIEAPEGTASPARVSEDGERVSTDETRSPPLVYEAELKMLGNKSRANTFGPNVHHPKTMVRPLQDIRAASAPEVERREAFKEESGMRETRGGLTNDQRASTIPRADVHHQTNQHQHEHSGWGETLHSLKERYWDRRPKDG
ncbi:hypothetical protein QBC34DRAFT_418896 [Podospora aff. communis PSN243]|uniref:Uncharacterized protein n=1 Tax=Podospora aff. communis PSN243 TaxID=3040156 RepID=A0AAV9FYR3_9PEZI|nr:hypothetical protein QBC34DRAFT_418896 [Podospora aff. communis PSN243]